MLIEILEILNNLKELKKQSEDKVAEMNAKIKELEEYLVHEHDYQEFLNNDSKKS